MSSYPDDRQVAKYLELVNDAEKILLLAVNETDKRVIDLHVEEVFAGWIDEFGDIPGYTTVALLSIRQQLQCHEPCAAVSLNDVTYLNRYVKALERADWELLLRLGSSRIDLPIIDMHDSFISVMSDVRLERMYRRELVQRSLDAMRQYVRDLVLNGWQIGASVDDLNLAINEAIGRELLLLRTAISPTT